MNLGELKAINYLNLKELVWDLTCILIKNGLIRGAICVLVLCGLRCRRDGLIFVVGFKAFFQEKGSLTRPVKSTSAKEFGLSFNTFYK